MLSIDKDKFFIERQLPKVKYGYIYDGEEYEISLDEVISRIGHSENKCLFLLNEFNATNNFLINVYLQDIADECVQINLRNNLYDEISVSLLVDHKSYKFQINEDEYIAYQDDEGRYHAEKVDEVVKTIGDARYSGFQNRLFGLLKMHIFDCQRVKKPIVS